MNLIQNLNSFDTVDLLDGNVFQVTWDVGRRCNYDCSYCPTHRHDNFSPHASLEDLKKNAEFVLRYIDLYMTTFFRTEEDFLVFHHPLLLLLCLYRRPHKERAGKFNYLVQTAKACDCPLSRIKPVQRIPSNSI